MVQDSLPDGLLPALAENLMLTGPAPARLGHQGLTPTRQPLRPPFVHRLQRHLEHRRDVFAIPPRDERRTARIRSASCAVGANCRASPTSSLTQEPTTKNTYGFGSIGRRHPTRIRRTKSRSRENERVSGAIPA